MERNDQIRIIYVNLRKKSENIEKTFFPEKNVNEKFSITFRDVKSSRLLNRLYANYPIKSD